MSQERFIKLVNGIYRVTEPGKHDAIDFEVRGEIKAWLVRHGVISSIAENSLADADQGRVSRVSVIPRRG